MFRWFFNAQAFGTALRQKRGNAGLRSIAQITGLSASTLSRIEHCGKPDIDTFIVLCNWLDCDPRAFFFTPEPEPLPFEELL